MFGCSRGPGGRGLQSGPGRPPGARPVSLRGERAGDECPGGRPRCNKRAKHPSRPLIATDQRRPRDPAKRQSAEDPEKDSVASGWEPGREP